ncbi:MAG: hypothetical protein Athens101428_632 [Candidatus Berkelbacteria bacterium Athens1014_28]|uniref:Uncharacterized protein n=1 Tax=Candidatus Berkelbacteria bacterium Athens1014_28 TaxID=2017145 RepID=A0A554LL47_9BACT|nr:MAG: hypothetical protein Athens101428_632 [Candidatus Berkelbacteria bacterium Athens1014_28]
MEFCDHFIAPKEIFSALFLALTHVRTLREIGEKDLLEEEIRRAKQLAYRLRKYPFPMIINDSGEVHFLAKTVICA